jgi:hypothetical protein
LAIAVGLLLLLGPLLIFSRRALLLLLCAASAVRRSSLEGIQWIVEHGGRQGRHWRTTGWSGGSMVAKIDRRI